MCQQNQVVQYVANSFVAGTKEGQVYADPKTALYRQKQLLHAFFWNRIIRNPHGRKSYTSRTLRHFAKQL